MKETTPEQITEIVKLAKDHTIEEIEKITEVPKSQINNAILSTIKTLRAAGSEQNKQEKVEEYIKANLNPPDLDLLKRVKIKIEFGIEDDNVKDVEINFKGLEILDETDAATLEIFIEDSLPEYLITALDEQ